MNTQNTTELYENILTLLEEGKSEAAILETYSDQKFEVQQIFAVINSLGAAKSIQPSQALFQATLAKLPKMEGTKIELAKVLQSTKSPFWQNISVWQKWGAVTAALLIIFTTGGLVATHYTNPAQTLTNSSDGGSELTTTSPDDTSDAALDQDLNSIDSQLNSLDSDTSQVDQVLHS